jgi:hypothetical protein
MRGAYGKPNGLCARVNINQVITTFIVSIAPSSSYLIKWYR